VAGAVVRNRLTQGSDSADETPFGFALRYSCGDQRR
jgi:hypothetical protein